MFFKYCLQVCSLSIYSLNNVFHMADIFEFHEFQHNHFSFINCGFGIVSKKKKITTKPKVMLILSCFLLEVIQLFLTLLRYFTQYFKL